MLQVISLYISLLVYRLKTRNDLHIHPISHSWSVTFKLPNLFLNFPAPLGALLIPVSHSAYFVPSLALLPSPFALIGRLCSAGAVISIPSDIFRLCKDVSSFNAFSMEYEGSPLPFRSSGRYFLDACQLYAPDQLCSV